MIYRIFIYPTALITLILLLNIDISGQTQNAQHLISGTPFFARFKIYFALSALVLLSGLVEKSLNLNLDKSIVFSLFMCTISLIFLVLGWKFYPEEAGGLTYSYFDYFKILFSGAIGLSMYLHLFRRSKNFNNSM